VLTVRSFSCRASEAELMDRPDSWGDGAGGRCAAAQSSMVGAIGITPNAMRFRRFFKRVVRKSVISDRVIERGSCRINRGRRPVGAVTKEPRDMDLREHG
jgi:hypothetical protein